MRDIGIKDPISLVSEIVRDALWGVRYHEDGLKEAHAKLKWAREVMKRCEVDENVEDPEVDEDGEPLGFESLSQFVMDIVDERESSVEYHEKSLAQSHQKVAYAMILLQRGNYTEIDVEQIKQKVDEELKKKSANAGKSE